MYNIYIYIFPSGLISLVEVAMVAQEEDWLELWLMAPYKIRHSGIDPRHSLFFLDQSQTAVHGRELRM